MDDKAGPEPGKLSRKGSRSGDGDSSSDGEEPKKEVRIASSSPSSTPVKKVITSPKSTSWFDEPPEKEKTEKNDKFVSFGEPADNPSGGGGGLSSPQSGSRKGSMKPRRQSVRYHEVVFTTDTPIEQVFSNPAALDCFTKFLQAEFSEENITFWHAVNEVALLEDIAMQDDQSRVIAETYIGDKALHQVNISSGFDDRIQKALAIKDQKSRVMSCLAIFAEAQAEIIHVLRADSFRRFTSSSLWTEFVENFKKRKLFEVQVAKMNKYHKNTPRLMQLDSHSHTLTFLKSEGEGKEFDLVSLVLKPINVIKLKLWSKNRKVMKLTFFPPDQKFPPTQKRWKLLFDDVTEAEKMVTMVTEGLLSRRRMDDYIRPNAEGKLALEEEDIKAGGDQSKELGYQDVLHSYSSVAKQVDNGIIATRRVATYLKKICQAKQIYVNKLLEFEQTHASKWEDYLEASGASGFGNNNSNSNPNNITESRTTISHHSNSVWSRPKGSSSPSTSVARAHHSKTNSLESLGGSTGGPRRGVTTLAVSVTSESGVKSQPSSPTSASASASASAAAAAAAGGPPSPGGVITSPTSPPPLIRPNSTGAVPLGMAAGLAGAAGSITSASAQLQDLQLRGPVRVDEDYRFVECVGTIQNTIRRMAQQDELFVSRVINEVVTPMQNLAVFLDSMKKQVDKEERKLSGDMQAVNNVVINARGKSLKLIESLIGLEAKKREKVEKENKSKTELKMWNLLKFSVSSTTVEETRDKAYMAAKHYEQSVQVASARQKTYFMKDLPRLLQVLHKIETQRLQQMKKLMQQYSTIHYQLVLPNLGSSRELRSSALGMDPEKDMHEFSNALFQLKGRRLDYTPWFTMEYDLPVLPDDIKDNALESLRNPVFGCSIVELMERQKRTRAELTVPIVFDVLLRAVRDLKGYLELGVFRRPPNINELFTLRKQFDNGDYLINKSAPDAVHLFCSLIKEWLKCLPDSIIPCHLYEVCLSMGKQLCEGEPLTADMDDIFGVLPASSQAVLSELARLFADVAANRASTQTSLEDIARIFAPLLLRDHGVVIGDQSPAQAVHRATVAITKTRDPLMTMMANAAPGAPKGTHEHHSYYDASTHVLRDPLLILANARYETCFLVEFLTAVK